MTITGPLASIDVHRPDRTNGEDVPSCPSTRPLALLKMVPATDHSLPDHTYDPIRQVAVDDDGRPVAAKKGKEWTSYESTHTDGDGGDNETWGWEEQ